MKRIAAFIVALSIATAVHAEEAKQKFAIMPMNLMETFRSMLQRDANVQLWILLNGCIEANKEKPGDASASCQQVVDELKAKHETAVRAPAP